jgi:hypothetical protein
VSLNEAGERKRLLVLDAEQGWRQVEEVSEAGRYQWRWMRHPKLMPCWAVGRPPVIIGFHHDQGAAWCWDLLAPKG